MEVSRERDRTTARGSRRGTVGANVAVMLAAAVALWAVANMIAARNPWIRDLTAARKFSIGPFTRSVLADLETSGRRITITILAPEGDIVFGRIRDLLVAYAARGSAIRVEFVDPDFDAARFRLFVERFGEAPNLPAIAFECEGRTKALSRDDVVETPRLPDGSPDPRVEPRFRGEGAITAAILSVAEERRRRIYFTQGAHDEADIEGFGRYDMALWARELRLQNLDVLPLELPRAERIPEDADLVVIAGPNPEIPFEDRELFLLERYLDRGGSLFLLLEPPSPPDIARGVVDTLARWLEPYGARLPIGQVVLDPPYKSEHPIVFLTNHYGDHPITKELGGSFMGFSLARPIEPVADGAKGFTPRPLVSTSPEGWTETDIDPERIREPRFDPEEDLRGPVPLAVALEGPPRDGMDAASGRIVVLGDTDPCTNEGLANFANRTFAMSAVNWLARRESLVAVPSRPFEERRLLDVGPTERRAVFWISILGLPGAALALGAAVWAVRRR